MIRSLGMDYIIRLHLEQHGVSVSLDYLVKTCINKTDKSSNYMGCAE